MDYYLLKGTDHAKGSLSAYYYSGMRDWFVGSLCAIAVFLIIYKVFERHAENVLSTLAGLAALGIALFSTAPAWREHSTHAASRPTRGIDD